MKRMLTVAGLTAAIAAAGALHHAASAETGTAHQLAAAVTAGTVASQVSPALPADLPVLRGKYWTRAGCEQAGRDGIDRGHWSQYQCADGTLQWILWTDR